MLKGRKYLMAQLLKKNSKKCLRYLVYCCVNDTFFLYCKNLNAFPIFYMLVGNGYRSLG
jgi:hypothetical protein